MAVQPNPYSNNISYDCKTERVTICGVDVASSLDIGFSNRCCSDATVTRWYQEGYQLGISISDISIDSIECDPIEPCPCNWRSYWKVNIDMVNVASMTGTKKITAIFDGWGYYTTVTTPIVSSDFNTIQEQYYSLSNFKVEYNVVFNLIGGGTVTMYWKYETEENLCAGDSPLPQVLNITTDLANSYTYSSDDCLVLPYALQDGFYTFTINGRDYCLVVDCASLECRVFTWIDSHVLKCEACNDKETLDKALELYMWFDMLKSDCSDCCTKCAVYDKIIDIVDGCLTC